MSRNGMSFLYSNRQASRRLHRRFAVAARPCAIVPGTVQAVAPQTLVSLSSKVVRDAGMLELLAAEMRIAELEKHKAKTIILVDAQGQHSGTHAREMLKTGFNAAKLSGGISSWRGDNLPLVK